MDISVYSAHHHFVIYVLYTIMDRIINKYHANNANLAIFLTNSMTAPFALTYPHALILIIYMAKNIAINAIWDAQIVAVIISVLAACLHLL